VISGQKTATNDFHKSLLKSTFIIKRVL